MKKRVSIHFNLECCFTYLIPSIVSPKIELSLWEFSGIDAGKKNKADKNAVEGKKNIPIWNNERSEKDPIVVLPVPPT